MSNTPNPIDEDIIHRTPNGKLRILVICILFLVIAGLILLELFPRFRQFEKLEKEAAAEFPAPVVRVMIAKPNKKEVDLVLPSYLQAINVTPIWARVNGYLRNWYADIGDKVSKGQLLADIETPELDQELDQARANLVNFEAQLEIARISADRWQNLYHRNSEAISVQEVDERNSTFRSAIANVHAAEANVRRLEAFQAFKQIYAPFDGIITRRDIDIGSLITAGSSGILFPAPLGNPQELFQIAKIDILRAFVDVPQTYYRLIKDGLEAQTTIKEYPGKIFKGAVDRTTGSLDPIARTLRTQVNIYNPKGELLPGVYAQIKFSFVPDTLTFIIPTNALVILSGPPYVAVVDEDHKVRLQQVEIGLDFGKFVEITSGIKENDLIIVNPTTRIQDGVVVQIASTQS